jgi:23S rRNA (guanosine2251-2'-O)-methyltransferase
MSFVLYGINPLLEALAARPGGIRKIYVARGKRGPRLKEILSRAIQNRIPLDEIDKDHLAKLAKTTSHQGVAGVVSDYPYSTVDDIIDGWHRSAKPLLLLVLDGIKDPQNLGSLIRSGHLFGVHGVVIPKDRAAHVTPAVAKASAGAVEHTLISRVVNLASTLERIKKEGAWVAGACADGDTSLYKLDAKLNLALVVGSEERGIRPLVRKKCDFAVSIPMEGKIGSLNAAVAGAVALSEIARQRSLART